MLMRHPFQAKNTNYHYKCCLVYFSSEETEGYDICQNALEWWKENSLSQKLVIGGGRDPLVPLEKMKMLSKIISTDEQTHVINNAGHFVPEWGMEFGEELFESLKNE